MPTPSDELAAPLRRLTRSFGHARLAAFFLLTAALATWVAGWLLPAAAGEQPSPPLVAGTAAAVIAVTTFIGVVVHRQRINIARWRETEQYLERIRRESERYRALMEGAADLLLVVDSETGTVRECNAVARNALGLHTEGERVSLVGPEGADRAVTVFELARAGGERALVELFALAGRGEGPQSVVEVRLRTPSNEELLADARVAVVRFGGESSMLLSLRDVTRQKRLERELQIRERLSSIGLMTAGVAHDINNPLEGIGNYLRLLANRDLPEETRQRYLARIAEGFERIRSLVHELLRFTGPGGPHGPVELGGVVRRACKMAAFAPDVQASSIELLGLDAPLHVVGDGSRLEQLVFNLVTNAATAMRGRDGARIEIAARALAEDGGPAAVEVEVSDTGPGLDPADLDRVFDPFFTRTGSLGLGLSVCYATALAHGGVLRVANRERGGAVFSFRIPAAVPSKAETSRA
jgi:signal transduction histidine kinase